MICCRTDEHDHCEHKNGDKSSGPSGGTNRRNTRRYGSPMSYRNRWIRGGQTEYGRRTQDSDDEREDQEDVDADEDVDEALDRRNGVCEQLDAATAHQTGVRRGTPWFLRLRPG